MRGENTPEQQSAELGRQLEELEQRLADGTITNEERARYIELSTAKRNIDRELKTLNEEKEKARKKKEKWIKIGAAAVGIGVAFATPALGVAAIVGITLGGKIAGKALQSWGNKLRTSSNEMKYESRRGKTLAELQEMDGKQKRKEWWANRLGEAGAALTGGVTGYAIGSLFEGLIGKDLHIGMNNEDGGIRVGKAGGSEGNANGGDNYRENPNSGGGHKIGGSPEVEPTDSVIVKDGKVDLPGSAWDGNWASGPDQTTLPGGAENFSNYAGSVQQMAPFKLDHDLVGAGITKPELLDNLGTSGVHQLLNRYVSEILSGNTSPDLAKVLEGLNPEAAKVLLKN